MRAALLLPLLALAACGEGVSPGPATPPKAGSYAADGVVLRVTYEGGLAPRAHAGELPLWTLYGDGSVLTQGPHIDIHPGPAWPNVQVQKVSAEAVDGIVAAAVAAGVDGKQHDYGDPPVADAVTTVFRLGTESGTYTTKVYALDEGDGGPGLTEEQRAARKRLADLKSHLGAAVTTPSAAYEPASVAVFARPYRKPPGEQLREQKVAWRGPDPKAGSDSPAGRCTVVTGAALATVLKDLKASNTLTRWQAEGGDWSFTIRPLLPGERTCADVLGTTVTPRGQGTPVAAPGGETYAAGDVVLRMANVDTWTRSDEVPHLAEWTLYGDGRVVSTLAADVDRKHGSWPDVREYTVTRKTVGKVVAAAREAGVGTQAPDHPCPDCSETVFALKDGAGTVETRVPGFHVGTGRGTAEDEALRERLRELERRITDFDGWLGATPKENDPYYRPARFAIFATPYVPRPGDGAAAPKDAPWTGPDPARGERTRAGRCTVLDRATLPGVDRKRLMGAHPRTRWDAADGTHWTFALRLLLPDEETCADALAGY
jgi:hypothetical protein